MHACMHVKNLGLLENAFQAFWNNFLFLSSEIVDCIAAGWMLGISTKYKGFEKYKG